MLYKKISSSMNNFHILNESKDKINNINENIYLITY